MPIEMYFDDYDLVRSAVAMLSESQQIVIRSRFWEDESYETVANRYMVTRERVRQIQIIALKKLRVLLQNDCLLLFYKKDYAD